MRCNQCGSAEIRPGTVSAPRSCAACRSCDVTDLAAADRCDGCGEVVSHLDAGFSPATQGMAHGCGGRWVPAIEEEEMSE